MNGGMTRRLLPNWPGQSAPAFFGRKVCRRAVLAHAEDSLRIGVMSGDAEVLMEHVADEAKSRGLQLQVTAFSDYLLPNEALDHGDLDAAVVNTDCALKANLGLDLRIGSEAVDGNPYRNAIAVRAGSEGDPRLRTLVDAYHSDAVRQFIFGYYQGRQLPAW